MKKETYNITGMSCAACQAAVTRAVEKLEGTENVNVNLMQNKMTVELSDGVTDEMIIKAVTDAGYGANVLRKEKSAGKVNSTNVVEDFSEELKKRAVISDVLRNGWDVPCSVSVCFYGRQWETFTGTYPVAFGYSHYFYRKKIFHKRYKASY